MSVRATEILERGLKLHALDLTTVDTRFVESREFALSDVARAFDLLPSRLAIEGVFPRTDA